MLRRQGNGDREPRSSDIVNFLKFSNEKTLLARELLLNCEAVGSITIPSQRKSMGQEDFRTMLHTQKILGRRPISIL